MEDLTREEIHAEVRRLEEKIEPFEKAREYGGSSQIIFDTAITKAYAEKIELIEKLRCIKWVE